MKSLRKLYSPRRHQKGFTLIELLIVVAVLGILAAVAIPNITGFITSGNLSAANSELQAVQTAVQGYMSDNPPGSANALTATDVAGNSGATGVTVDLDPYLGTTTLKATYIVNANGEITGATALTTGGWPTSITFSGGKWVRG